MLQSMGSQRARHGRLDSLNNNNKTTILVPSGSHANKASSEPFQKLSVHTQTHIFKSTYECIFVYVGIDYIYFSLFGVKIVHSAFIRLCHLLNWILKVYIKVKRASLVVKNGYVVKTLPANVGDTGSILGPGVKKKRTNKNLFLKSKELFHLQEMYLRTSVL